MQFCNPFVIISFVIITNCNFLKAVTVIFKNLNLQDLLITIKEKALIQNTFKFIKTNRILCKALCLCLVGIFSIVVSMVAVGITFGFKVNYSGKEIAVVGNRSIYEKASVQVMQSMSDKDAVNAIKSPKLTLTLTITDRLDNVDTVANAIIESTEEISQASVLKVNGEVIICGKTDELKECLEQSRCRFYISGAENSARFIDQIEVSDGYFLKSKIENIESVRETINNLQVETVSTLCTDVSVAYSTTKISTDKQLIGYKKVTTAGQNGITRKNEIVKTVNGVESERTLLSETVISEPVNCVITVGTAKSTATATERAEASSAGFICPISAGKYTITAYWGDGRGHKGLDMAADKGTPIFAVAAGTVVEASYSAKDYGYYVTIDHGNGIKTRYAHASALCVSKGATVSQGDMIACVGSTGRSTGNHLHFEVYKNGTRVNPVNYVSVR